jgi:hypothetical protein
LANAAVRLGRTLKIDAAKETIVEDQEATALLRRQYRKEGHWSIPAGV